jgi:hypothetical protein
VTGRPTARAVAVAIGLVATLPFVIGSLPAGAAPAPVLPVTTSPCAPEAGICTADPTSLTASWADRRGVTGIQIAWDGAGRPAAAPAPPSETVAVGTGSGRCTPSGASTACTWTWPPGLAEDGTFLDGTYLVTACVAVVGGRCTPSGAYGAAAVAVAVAPPPPAGPTASVSGDEVDLAWAPGAPPAAAGSPGRGGYPDAAGYSVHRNGTAIWTCYLLGAGPPGAPACTDPPVLVDRPGPGAWSYLVVALRLGADPDGSDLVGSAPSATVTATVGATTTTTSGTAGPGSTLPLPPVVSGATLPPAVGVAPPSSPAATVTRASTAPPGAHPATPGGPTPSVTPAPTAPTAPGGIRYPSGVRPGTHVHVHPRRSPALAAGVGHGGSGTSRPVVPAIVAALLLLAAALLVLAAFASEQKVHPR